MNRFQVLSSGLKHCQVVLFMVIQGYSGSIEIKLGQSGSKGFIQVNWVLSGSIGVDLGVLVVVGIDVSREMGVGQPPYLRFLVTDYTIEDRWRSC